MPEDIANPKWDERRKVHDWRNHVPEQVRGIWQTFTDLQKAALHEWAETLANNEEWD